MITKQIIELISQQPMSATDIAEKTGARKTVIMSMLTYMSKNGRVLKEITRKTESGKGRKTIYLYRVNDAAEKDGQGLDVGQQGAVSHQVEGAVSS